MKRTLVAGFGDFLNVDFNSSKEFVENIPEKNWIFKRILPVGYFKNDFIKPIKELKPEKVVFFGMDNSKKDAKFEVVALNEKIVLKNRIYRFFRDRYCYFLKFLGKNFRTKKPISRDLFIVNPIEKRKKEKVYLHTIPPKLKSVGISHDAGNYVCNYSMWIIENYIQDNNLDIEFYFVHLPLKLNIKQKQELIDFVLE